MSEPPGIVRREAALDHEIWSLPDSAKSRATVQRVVRVAVFALGAVGVLCVYLGLVIGAWLWVVAGLAVVAALILPWLPWEALFVGRRMELRVDEIGIRLAGESLRWTEIRRFEVEPYPRIDDSWVRCVFAKSERGNLAIGVGLELADLKALAEALEALRQEASADGRADPDALEALDTLLGRGSGR